MTEMKPVQRQFLTVLHCVHLVRMMSSYYMLQFKCGHSANHEWNPIFFHALKSCSIYEDDIGLGRLCRMPSRNLCK